MVSQRLLLPLLWSTFSARQAITEQQLVAVKQIITGLRTIHSRKFFRPSSQVEAASKREKKGSAEGDSGSEQDTVRESKLGDSLLIEEMSDAGRADLEAKVASGKQEPPAKAERNTFLHFGPDLEELPSLLGALSTNLSATSTTRTSLHSTLASYNSQLHTQDFISNSRGGGSREKDTEGSSKEEFVIGRALPEFEELRKEVRSLKGLLLSR